MDPKKKPRESTEETAIRQRKLEHVQVVLEKQAAYRHKTTGFELVEFEHNALPEIDFIEIDLSTQFLGRKLAAPLMITGMTGGYGQAEQINGDLAAAADKEGIAFGLGSMRALFEEPELAKTYGVRKRAPKAFLCGNIGGIQLKKIKVETIESVLSYLKADALCVHLNPMHEASQKDGDLDWRGVLPAITKLCKELKQPVIAKEVGTGISASVALKLEKAGVKAIDVSGAGGTSWAGGVEYYRGGSPTAELFWDWGIPTATALKQCSQVVKVPLIASGGNPKRAGGRESNPAGGYARRRSSTLPQGAICWRGGRGAQGNPALETRAADCDVRHRQQRPCAAAQSPTHKRDLKFTIQLLLLRRVAITVTDETTAQVARKFALANALEFGKASAGSVAGKVVAECPEAKKDM